MPSLDNSVKMSPVYDGRMMLIIICPGIKGRHSCFFSSSPGNIVVMRRNENVKASCNIWDGLFHSFCHGFFTEQFKVLLPFAFFHMTFHFGYGALF